MYAVKWLFFWRYGITKEEEGGLMKVTLFFGIVVFIGVIALVIFLVRQDQKDKRKLENKLNQDYKKPTVDDEPTDVL